MATHVTDSPAATTAQPAASRVLIVDDTRMIHEDFRKILAPARAEVCLPDEIFREPEPKPDRSVFEVDSSYQGQEGAERVAQALAEGRPYAVAFVDMRMPPGWDGIETARRLWAIDPHLQIVICTAFSDYSWEQTADNLGDSDNWVILKKPFDNIEVLQLAHALSKKWIFARRDRERFAHLGETVRQRTHALALSEERFEKAFHANPIPVTIQTARDGRYLDVNDAFLALVRRERDAILNVTPADLHLWASADVWQDALRSLENRNPLRGHRAQLRAKGGAIREVLVFVDRISLNDEPCVLTSLEDITERVQLEQQFRQAQKMEAVGQLAAGIAHDFNNVLTVIQTYTELTLADAALKPEHRSGLSQMKLATERASSLTRQLLLFSRRPIAPVRSLNIGTSLNGVRAMLSRVLPADVQLEWNCEPGLPRVLADEANLEQVVMNLVVNARDALPDGGCIRLGIRSVALDAATAKRHAEARAGEFVCLAVADNGTGIEAAVVGKIFEPFFTTKGKGKGTGLGLSTVYAIVKQHEGWIEVSSAPGVGTTFEIFLPVHKEQTAVNETPVPLPRATPVFWGQGERILLVEDEEVVRRAARLIATSAGYHVTEAIDAPSALKIWDEAKRPFDLLLTDMIMPNGTTGVELAAELRARNPALKVIVSTGYGHSALTESASTLEGVHLLPKPYDRSLLLSAIREAIKPVKSHQPAA